tara:strand:+ start:790 stop:1113 length:324 start_codon:yes stop_codon:yes gene_type:complete
LYITKGEDMNDDNIFAISRIVDIEGVKLSEAEIMTLNGITGTIEGPDSATIQHLEMLVLTGLIFRNANKDGDWENTWGITEAGKEFKTLPDFIAVISEIVENETFLN